MSNEAVVHFQSGSAHFRVVLPHGGEPQNMGTLLVAIAKTTKDHMSPGELTSSFLAEAWRTGINAKLSSVPATSADYQYTVENNGTGLRVKAVLVKTGVQIYNGSLDNLGANYTSGDIEKTMGKIVKFKYNGGSTPGADRIVKVTKVSKTHLRGYDLEESLDSEKKQHRSYKISTISGSIYLVK